MDEDRSPAAQRTTLASHARGFDRSIGLLLLLAILLLLLGWMLPIMTIDTLLILSERVSILQACMELWHEDHYFLFLVVGLFSVVFPIVKLCLALALWYGADLANPFLPAWLARLEMMGRWSMLDVFAVAFGVAASQISLISEVSLHAGLYVFTAAVVLSMAIVQRMTVLARRALPALGAGTAR